MAESDQDTQDRYKEPFVPHKDRPEVRISLDTPLGELRVRELSAILGFMVGKNPNFEAGKTSIKEFFDKPFPEVAKDWIKEVKSDKFEKIEKLEKPEKPEKLEKHEKFEKHEKPEKPELRDVIDPGIFREPDPRMEQVIQAISGLTRQVSQLADQVEELRKKVSG